MKKGIIGWLVPVLLVVMVVAIAYAQSAVTSKQNCYFQTHSVGGGVGKGFFCTDNTGKLDYSMGVTGPYASPSPVPGATCTERYRTVTTNDVGGHNDKTYACCQGAGFTATWKAGYCN